MPKKKTLYTQSKSRCGWCVSHIAWMFAVDDNFMPYDQPKQFCYVSYTWFCITENDVLKCHLDYKCNPVDDKRLQRQYCSCQTHPQSLKKCDFKSIPQSCAKQKKL